MFLYLCQVNVEIRNLITLNLPYSFYLIAALRLVSNLEGATYVVYGADIVNRTEKVLQVLQFGEGDTSKNCIQNNWYLWKCCWRKWLWSDDFFKMRSNVVFWCNIFGDIENVHNIQALQLRNFHGIFLLGYTAFRWWAFTPSTPASQSTRW